MGAITPFFFLFCDIFQNRSFNDEKRVSSMPGARFILFWSFSIVTGWAPGTTLLERLLGVSLFGVLVPLFPFRAGEDEEVDELVVGKYECPLLIGELGCVDCGVKSCSVLTCGKFNTHCRNGLQK